MKNNLKKQNALIIGAGAFGTSMASVVANNFEKVVLLVRADDVYQGIKNKKENTVYLPGEKLADNIFPAKTYEEAELLVSNSFSLIISGLPTEAIRLYFKAHQHTLLHYLKRGVPLVSLTKGIDTDTLEMVDDLLFDIFPEHREQFCFLSGPSFAKEIMEEQITLVSVAGRSKKNLELVTQMLATNYFKALPTYDIKGLLLGGALKNVLAIAGGVLEGLGYNHNTRAAMITRGISEMLRFGKVFNARPETFYGLSGMGDLILTTTGEISRNKLFGLEIAKGRNPKEIINSQRTVVEGYKTTKAAYDLSIRYDIHSNIFHGAYDVLYRNAPPREVITKIMNIPAKFELD